VLPAVTDKWAASTLRSAMQLLNHLALRIDHEPALLQQQLVELIPALTATHADLAAAAQQVPQLRALRDQLERALHGATATPDNGVILERRVEALLAAAERVIAARDAVRAATGSSVITDTLVQLLARQLARELPLIEPFQSKPPI
jgi:hypothetical protein